MFLHERTTCEIPVSGGVLKWLTYIIKKIITRVCTIIIIHCSNQLKFGINHTHGYKQYTLWV